MMSVRQPVGWEVAEVGREMGCMHKLWMRARAMLAPHYSFAIVAAACLAVNSAAGDEGRVEFNRDVRPILLDTCFACHGPDSAARQADLRLDKREIAVELGEITPGD